MAKITTYIPEPKEQYEVDNAETNFSCIRYFKK
jgi:hypothetical protein